MMKLFKHLIQLSDQSSYLIYMKNIYTFSHLLLVFSLRSQPSLDTLSSFNERFSLCFLARPMRKNTRQICACECYYGATDLLSIRIVITAWVRFKWKQIPI